MDQQFDVKKLVLKRWDASQTKSLLDDNVLSLAQFVSFQSHHYIDIISSTQECSLLGDYNNFRSSQASSQKKDHNFSDIHTVQNMTLIGNSRDFWDDSASVMYITLIQLSDSSAWKYDTIYNSIQRYFTEADISQTKESKLASVQWALYYSLDYCDFVLFTKKILFDTLNDLLWKMALIDNDDFNVIRDTFTIYCFDTKFLKDAFGQIRKGAKQLTPEWNDVLSLSMNFSIRDYSAEQLFTTAFAEIENGALKFQYHRLHGRYDLNYVINQVTGTQVLKILYKINEIIKQHQIEQFTQSGPTGRFLPICSEYEIAFLSAAADYDKLKCKREKTLYSSFDFYASKMIEKLYSLISEKEQSEPAAYIEYVKETLRSLHELAKNDFSEEFVLCVLPSIIAFLRIITQKQSFLRKEDNDIVTCDKIHESCAKLQRSYFTAMNTLSLCTMHSERQFIHTPAFNANYFDIPPKLLAYYNAIVYNIAYQLKSAELPQPSYHYIIIPDYRTDIHVEPLNITYKEDTDDHLAIICLSEKYFYQPSKAIMLLAHEVGHYEGERRRKCRAKKIFYLIGITIFYYTPLKKCISNKDTYFTKDTLVYLFSEIFASYLDEQFNNFYSEGNRRIPYILSDITDFLTEYRYGISFLESFAHRSELIQRWIEALTKYSSSDSGKSEVENVLKNIFSDDFSDDDTNYFKELSQHLNCPGVCETIARTVSAHCEAMVTQRNTLNTLNTPNPVGDIMAFCREIIELFAESYADWQMHSILGDFFNIEAYRNMLSEARGAGISSTLETNHKLRSIVMDRMCGNTATKKLNMLEETVVQCVIGYLTDCETPHSNSMDFILKAVYQPSTNRKEWCQSLCSTLSNYETKIQSMYDINNENILTDPVL